MNIKKAALAVLALIGCSGVALAQKPAAIQTVLSADESFNKLISRKGMKDAFLSVADIEGVVFKPEAVKITDFYGSIAKQPGTFKGQAKFGRISTSGDLAFTAGPYEYTNSGTDQDTVYGHYVSVWRADANHKLKLLINIGTQHPEPAGAELIDFKEPDATVKSSPTKDPFGGKFIIGSTDKQFDATLTLSTLATYKEFFSADGRFYFPGFEPITGRDKVLKFLDNEAISMSAVYTNAGRAASGDLGYSYGKARIKKGNIVSNYNYVRIWEIDANHKWNILLEMFSAIENE